MKKLRESKEKLAILTPPMPWHKASVDAGEKGTVVLLHGLWRSKASMKPMATFLNQVCGFKTICVPYKSVRESYKTIVQGVLELLEEQGVVGEVSFVTHSLGGIVLRGLLADTNRKWRLKRAVMLAPPNKGSQIVDWLRASPLKRLLGEAGNYLIPENIDSVVPELNEPEKVAVIMGDDEKLPLFKALLDEENDGIVSVEDGRLEGLAKFCVMNCDHTFITVDKKVQQLTGEFLLAAEQ